MALMDREEHESLLEELLQEELTNDRKVDILQSLRADHVSGHEEFATLETTNNTLSTQKDELILANSKMFRQLGIVGDPDKEKDEEKKEFSETVTIKELEENSGLY